MDLIRNNNNNKLNSFIISLIILLTNVHNNFKLKNIGIVNAIDCFVCTSYNHDNPKCEDPFYRSNTVTLKENCLTVVPEQEGFHRATHCLKLIAEGHGYSYVIRTCSISTGTGRLDEEIVGVSHCGYLSLRNFYGLNINSSINETLSSSSSSSSSYGKIFQKSKNTPLVRDVFFKGCLTVCNQNECNKSPPSSLTIHSINSNLKYLIVFIFIFYFIF